MSRSIADTFWSDEDIRKIMPRHRFKHHAVSRVPSCFKKGCECCFLFPFCAQLNTSFDPKELDPECTVPPWHQFSDPEVVWLSPCKTGKSLKIFLTCHSNPRTESCGIKSSDQPTAHFKVSI
jgi:hypothetical protein